MLDYSLIDAAMASQWIHSGALPAFAQIAMNLLSTTGDRMSTSPVETNANSRLRLDAEVRLREGTAPPTKGWPTGANALSLLHALASSPATAHDALKLLHELQVHQVELDLQYEQVEATRREIAEDLVRYKSFYEAAPAGYFSVDSAGCILEANVAGAELFGLALAELNGRHLESFVAPASRPALLELLQTLREGVSRAAAQVQAGGGWSARLCRVAASVAPDGASFLLIFVPLADRNRS
jgi:PAS domain S-box-containing protein